METSTLFNGIFAWGVGSGTEVGDSGGTRFTGTTRGMGLCTGAPSLVLDVGRVVGEMGALPWAGRCFRGTTNPARPAAGASSPSTRIDVAPLLIKAADHS